MERMDGGQDRKLRHDEEIDRLRELRDRQPATQQEFTFQGVLLSDAIEDCVSSFGLITPFKRENLKSASYKLRIGDEYSIDGKIIPLVDEPGRNRIIIPPFAVAIIKTLEIVNMPRFLIGRWNIQVSKAYEGLVWVGGPQVDPGYVGYLFCPIYNLRDKAVELTMGKSIAVIDFVTTTPVGPRSKTYPFPPDRILFEDYEPQTLISGIAKTYEEVRRNNESTGRQLEQVATRIAISF
jgi:deoxycytidine triphosphate deaminase